MTIKRAAAVKVAPEAEPYRVLETRVVDIDSLKLDPNNVKEHSDEVIEAQAKLLDEFGQRKNIVVDESGTIIAGNRTWLAAKLRGWKEITVADAPKDPVRARAFALSDNRSSELSKMNESKVGRELSALARLKAPVSILGWNDKERAALVSLGKAPITAVPKTSTKPDEDVIPEPPKIPVTKPGDRWKLGDHVLICGDSFKPEVRAYGFKDGAVDLVLTDPPYAIYGSSTGIGADIADDRMVRPFFGALFILSLEALKPFGHFYMCCDWRSYSAVAESSRDARARGAYGLVPKNLIVWDKGHGLGSMFAQCHEFIAFYSKTPAPKAMKAKKGAKSEVETGQRMVLQKNVFSHERAHGEDRLHNAAKPPPLMRFFIECGTDKGEHVVDFFGGSGTTLIAAEQLERRATVFEVEPKNCDIIVERWERLFGKKAKRVKA